MYGFNSAVCLIIMHLCMFYFKAFQFVSFYLCTTSWGQFPGIVHGLVASSSPVGGSGMLTLEGTDFLVLGVCGCPRS